MTVFSHYQIAIYNYET